MTRPRLIWRLVTLLACCLLGGFVSAGAAQAEDALSWSSPESVDHAAPFGEQPTLDDVACPSSGLCVAIDNEGSIVTSTDPSASPSSWTTTPVDRTLPHRLGAISCPSTSLCVAVRNHEILTSTDPAAGAWQVTTLEGPNVANLSPLWAVSCSPSDFCLATDGGGYVATSTDPAGGADAWHVSEIVARFNAVDCPSSSLCVGVSATGTISSSTDPGAGDSRWSTASVAPSGGVETVSCPSTSLCVAGNEYGDILTSTDPTGGASAWQTAQVSPWEGGPREVSCPTVSACVAITVGGKVLTSTDPTGGASAWSETTSPVVSEPIDGGRISCPTAAFCLTYVPGYDFAERLPRDRVAASSEPFSEASAWHETTGVDSAGSDPLGALACVGTGLCVGVERSGYELSAGTRGRIVTSTDPAVAGAPWNVGAGPDGESRLGGVSCPSASFCAAVDEESEAILTTTDPAAGAASWQATVIGGPSAVSCPLTSFCVAAGEEYEESSVSFRDAVMPSSEPTGGAGAWGLTPIGAFEHGGVPTYFLSISCPSASFCAAINEEGGIATSSDPSGGTGAWTLDELPYTETDSISCASSALCVASTMNGEVLVSTDPADGTSATWTDTTLVGPTIDDFPITINDVSCPSASFCAAVDSEGQVLTTSEPAGWLGAWTIEQIDPDDSLLAISCSSSTFCVATDRGGNALIGQSGSGSPEPHATNLPTISGTAAVDQTLVEAHASWTNDPTSYRYQWELCDPSGGECQAITGATSQSYTPSFADVGSTLRVQETASNASGTGAPSMSGTTAAVEPPSLPPEEEETTEVPTGGNEQPTSGGGSTTGTPPPGNSEIKPSGKAGGVSAAKLKAAIAAQLQPHGKAAAITGILKAGGYLQSFTAPAAGKLTIQWFYAPPASQGKKAKDVLVADGSKSFGSAGGAKLRVKLTAAGKKLLKKIKRVKIEVRARFVASKDAPSASVSAKLTLKA